MRADTKYKVNGNARYFMREAAGMFGAKSLLAVISMMMLILLSAALVSGYIVGRGYSEKLANEAEIAVFYEEAISSEKIAAELSGLSGVLGVSHVSRKEAYEEMKGYLGSEVKLLEKLGNNPFQAYFRVRVEPGISTAELEDISNASFVTHVRDNRDVLKKIDAITNALAVIGLTVVVVSVLTCAFITYYVSAENISARREQIENLLYMGAPYEFIVKPFVLHSIFVSVPACAPAVIAAYFAGGYLDFGVAVEISFVGLALSPVMLVTGIIATHISARGFK